MSRSGGRIEEPHFSYGKKQPVHLTNGDVILFSGGIAVVRFFGQVKFGDGMFVGLELSGPMGDCDGARNGVRYYRCSRNHGKFIRVGDVKRKITAEELLLKLNSEVEKAPKGKLSLKEKKELERQINELATALSKQKEQYSDLEAELSRVREAKATSTTKTKDVRRVQSEPIKSEICESLEKSIHQCFAHAHELLKDFSGLLSNNSNISEIDEKTKTRLDDNLHLMLYELINSYTTAEGLGLVTRVEPVRSLDTFGSFEAVVTNKERPPISELFSPSSYAYNPRPPEIDS